MSASMATRNESCEGIELRRSSSSELTFLVGWRRTVLVNGSDFDRFRFNDWRRTIAGT